MRIAYLFHDLGKSGGFVVLYHFMDQLVARGHDVFAVTPSGSFSWKPRMSKEVLSLPDDRFKKSLRSNVKAFVQSQFGTSAKERLRIMYEMKKIMLDLVKHWVPTDITIATYCLTAYAGYVLADRTVPFYHMQHFEEVFFPERMGRLLARNSYNLPLVGIANSTWLRNIVHRFFDKESYLLNPGIATEVFKPHKDPSTKYRAKDEWIIASYLDETREWKGFRDAVEVIKKVRGHFDKQGIKIHWRLFGLNAPTGAYDTEFEYRGRIFGEDLARYYSEADIVLVPSWYESFPLPPLEAMACGSLVVTTQYGTEDYAFDGDNAYVCRPRKIDDLAHKIIAGIEDPERSAGMVWNALKTVPDYTWERRTDILLEIFSQVVQGYDHGDQRFFNDLNAGRFEEYMYNLFNTH